MRQKLLIVVILILIPLLISCKQTIPSDETTNNTTENKTIENPATSSAPQTTPSVPETILNEPTTPSINETVNTEPTAIEEPTTPPPVFEPPVYVPTGGIEIIEDPSWWDTPYIEIYAVERDAFDYFLKNPSIETMHAQDMKRYQKALGFQRYWVYNSITIDITLFDFVKDKAKITDFLAQSEINITVDYVMIIDTPYIPILIWVSGGGESAFITIDEDIESNSTSYEYRGYTVSAFQEKFGCLYGSLKANGKDIPNTTVRIYQTYASDVPLMRVLEAYGAVIEKESDYLFSITFREKQYKLDLMSKELYEVGGQRGDLLFLQGGPVFMYPTEYDLMVDTYIVNSIMYDMGQPITPIRDRTNKVVIIKDRDE